MSNESTKVDTAIQRFYNSEAKSMADRHDKKGVHDTAIKQVMDILDSGAQHVVDVGSGPGSVMLEFLKNGMNMVTGVDLSPEMNKIAKQRILESGFSDKEFNLLNESFLDINSEGYDAVSLHRVICCHPDKEGMIRKSTEFNPKVISLTVPRTWIFLRILVGIFGIFAKLKSSFRPYLHSQKYIDKQLENQGYLLASRKKTLGWVQSTYTKKD